MVAFFHLFLHFHGTHTTTTGLLDIVIPLTRSVQLYLSSSLLLVFIVSGGALQIGKGIGKGITTGDGMAVVEGLTKGAASVGGGIAQGAESAVMGTADGIYTAGKGLFSGVRNVGQGIGGAIRGKKPSRFQRKAEDGNG
jgi:hypothetical protein